jgi:hypothetical protein
MSRQLPGSRRAHRAGCTCPQHQADEHALPRDGVWWVVPGCPIHDPEYRLDPDYEETEQNA